VIYVFSISSMSLLQYHFCYMELYILTFVHVGRPRLIFLHVISKKFRIIIIMELKDLEESEVYGLQINYYVSI